MASQFTAFEKAALDDICRRFPADAPALKSQLDAAHDIVRENTGAGFYTRFKIASAEARIDGDRLRSGGWARVSGFKDPVGFILWLDQGCADCLEIFTIDDDTTDVDLAKISFVVLPDTSN